MTAQTTGFAQLYNPTALTTQTLPWTDVNGDDIAQGERGCAYLTAGCEINFANLPTNFGVRSLARFDATSSGPTRCRSTSACRTSCSRASRSPAEYLQDLVPRHHLRANTLLNDNSYNRFDVVSPLDGSVIPVWVMKPEFRGQVDNLDSTSDGHEARLQRRGHQLQRAHAARRVARSAASTSSARSTTPARPRSTIPTCRSTAISPERDPVAEAVQGHGGLPAPFWGIQASLAYQNLNGYLSIGTAAQAYGPFTAGTGFDNPSGQATYKQSDPGQRRHVPRRSRRRCVHGGLASIQVPLVAPETKYAAAPPAGSLVQQAHPGRMFSITAEDRLLQRAELGRLLVGVDRADGAAAYKRPSVILQGTHHPHRRGCEPGKRSPAPRARGRSKGGAIGSPALSLLSLY